MYTDSIYIILLVALAFVFDFINGFHDAANSIATIVATEVLRPVWAVLWAGIFNFMAFFLFKLSVANTVGTGLIDPSVVTPYLIFSALIGAISWNLITWYYGMPSSSSHALIGGLAGAAVVKGGFSVLVFWGFFKVILAILLSPILGMIFSFLLMRLTYFLTADIPKNYKFKLFGYFQLASSAFLSIAHGGNDAQKTMGIIAVLLYSAGFLGEKFYVPFWVVLSCYLVLSLGTLAGGWKIVHTLGKKITPLNTMRGCCAETGGAITIGLATHFGIPVSTTHTVTGAIVGVGLLDGHLTTSWTVVKKIIYVWTVTLPASALISAFLMWVK